MFKKQTTKQQKGGVLHKSRPWISERGSGCAHERARVCVRVGVCVNAVFDQTGLKMSLEIRSIDKSDVEMYMKAYQSMARGRPCLF
jgi:hypothetical protein